VGESLYKKSGEKQMKLDHSTNTIVGAIAGDVIGSVYEWNNHRATDFEFFSKNCFFTDDTVLTIAVADAILKQKDFGRTIWEYGRTYPGRGYGGRFAQWLQSSDPKPYSSFGNGSAMRVSAVGFACITGGIASAYYKEIPKPILDFVGERLPEEFIQIIHEFDARWGK
jgi:ADP-ribosylglycohydrolase